MIVLRFKVQCQPDKIEQVIAAYEDVIAPSRALDGVINFDIGRDVSRGVLGALERSGG